MQSERLLYLKILASTICWWTKSRCWVNIGNVRRRWILKSTAVWWEQLIIKSQRRKLISINCSVKLLLTSSSDGEDVKRAEKTVPAHELSTNLTNDGNWQTIFSQHVLRNIYLTSQTRTMREGKLKPQLFGNSFFLTENSNTKLKL